MLFVNKSTVLISGIDAPGQLLAHGAHKAHIAQLNEIDRKIAFADCQLMVGSDRLEARVERTEKIICAALDIEGDHRVVGYDDRADIEVVRSDWRDDKIARIWENDRTAAAQ